MTNGGALVNMLAVVLLLHYISSIAGGFQSL